MRLAFMGSPDFAVPALRALADAGHEIAVVYVQPPRPAHRGQALTKCAVQREAEVLGLPVRTPERLRGDAAAQEAFRALDLDAAVVTAYGQILPQAMLDAPRLGCLNIHASLLPRWRGAAPIHAAILAGDAETGITIMRMEAGLDTGPMLLQEAVPIGPRATMPEVQEQLARMGGALILRALEDMPPPVPQPESGATYAAKLTREDGRLDFLQDATSLDLRVRALTPWPGSFVPFADGVLKVLEAVPVEGQGDAGTILDDGFTVATGRGALRLLRVQRAGRPAMEGGTFLRGIPNWRDLRLL